MSIDSNAFQLDIRKVAEAMHKLPVEIMRALAAKYYVAVSDRSPVDTGRFRASWRIGVGEPDLSTEDAVKKGDSIGQDQDVELGKLGALTETQVVSITNALPYAQRLNEGWSKQAPAGFIESTASVVEAELETTVQIAARAAGLT